MKQIEEAIIIKKPKLTDKERAFVKNRVKGMNQREAFKKAYKPSKDAKIETIDNNAYKVASRERVQQAIQQALEANEMTPEFAIRELKKIVEQDKELGAKRLAIKDVLELHGYKASTGGVKFNIERGFFSNSRG